MLWFGFVARFAPESRDKACVEGGGKGLELQADAPGVSMGREGTAAVKAGD